MHSLHYLHMYILLIVTFLMFYSPSTLTYLCSVLHLSWLMFYSLLSLTMTLYSPFNPSVSILTLCHYVPFSLCTSPCPFLSSFTTSNSTSPYINSCTLVWLSTRINKKHFSSLSSSELALLAFLIVIVSVLVFILIPHVLRTSIPPHLQNTGTSLTARA